MFAGCVEMVRCLNIFDNIEMVKCHLVCLHGLTAFFFVAIHYGMLPLNAYFEETFYSESDILQLSMFSVTNLFMCCPIN